MYLKLQRNFLKLIILSGFLFLGGQSFAQDPAAVEEHHDTKDLEELLKRYNTDSKKVLEDTSKILDQDATLTEVDESDINELANAAEDPKKITLNSLKKAREDAEKAKKKSVMTGELSSSVRQILEPMQKLSEKDLLKLLDDNSKNSKLRPYMDQFPNINIFAVRLIKDEESIPSLVKIIENRERLIRFAGVMLSTLILGFLLKKVMHREGRSFIRSAIYFLFRMYFMFAVRIYIVYFFFSAELAPAAKIFKKTFMA